MEEAPVHVVDFVWGSTCKLQALLERLALKDTALVGLSLLV